MKLDLHFTRTNGALRLERTEFCANDAAKKPAVMNAAGTGVDDGGQFQWKNGQRALCVLLLRALATNPVTAHALQGGEGSLARALDEVLRAKCAKNKPGVPTWIQTMFTGAQTLAPDLRLAPQVFDHHGNSSGGQFSVRLGREWQGAELAVRLDGKIQPRELWPGLADELEKGGGPTPPPPPLAVGLTILLAPPGLARPEIGDFQPVAPDCVPARGGQRLRLRITVSRPAHLYACWITPACKVQPLFPWKPQSAADWTIPADADQSRTELELPLAAPGKPTSWGLEQAAGLETCLAFARTEPLPPETVKELARTLAALPRAKCPGRPAPGPHDHHWQRQPTGTRIDFEEQPVADPVTERHAELRARLGLHPEFARCVSFLNAGAVKS